MPQRTRRAEAGVSDGVRQLDEERLTDGCSVPAWLRLVVHLESDEQRAACEDHDRDYTKGGTAKDRAVSDARLLLRLYQADMQIDLAHEYYLAVRYGGLARWGPKGRHTDDPGHAPAGQQEAP